MKFKQEIVIDADCETCWDAFEKVGDKDRWQVTDKRRPSFIAGNYITNSSDAVVVNHFEDAGDGRTRWTMYGNHSFRGFFRFVSIFFAGSIRKRNEDMMNNFKLFAETKQAERPA